MTAATWLPTFRTEEVVEETEPRRRGGLLTGVTVLAVSLVGLGSVTTGAWFTDGASVAGTSLTTGTVKLTASPVAYPVNLGNLAPGDTYTGPIQVVNQGSLAMRYAVVSTTSDDLLAGALRLTIKAGIPAAGCTAGAFAGSGTTVYAAGPVGSTSGTKVVGDPATGPQAGDRTLDAGTNEWLCAQLTLPPETGNALQGRTTSTTLTFSGEQTANNW